MARKISTDAVESVTEKLHRFAEGLEPEERAAVDAMLAKAVEGESDVAGFSFDVGNIGTVNLGTQDFDLTSTRSGLKNSLLGTFCDDEGGPWTLVLDDGSMRGTTM